MRAYKRSVEAAAAAQEAASSLFRRCRLGVLAKPLIPMRAVEAVLLPSMELMDRGSESLLPT